MKPMDSRATGEPLMERACRGAGGQFRRPERCSAHPSAKAQIRVQIGIRALPQRRATTALEERGFEPSVPCKGANDFRDCPQSNYEHHFGHCLRTAGASAPLRSSADVSDKTIHFRQATGVALKCSICRSYSYAVGA